MDGVIIDSEKFWKLAEYDIFSSLGVTITEENTLLTESMTTDKVIEFWYERFPWKNLSFMDVEKLVIDKVINLIQTSDCCIPNIKNFIENLKAKGLKIGLATNSPYKIIPFVLEKTNTTNLFDVISSAEHEIEGKPHPAIYRNTAKKMSVQPNECLVIEDSYYGIAAAKNADMTVAQFTNGNSNSPILNADYMIETFSEVTLIE